MVKENKFKYTLDDYFNFIAKLRKLGYKVKQELKYVISKTKKK